MIVFEVNNERQLVLNQEVPDGEVIAKSVEHGEPDPYLATRIPAGDMVMLINYYRYIKENDIYCGFVNPSGKKPKESLPMVF